MARHLVDLSEQRAALLDLQASNRGPDNGIAEVAAWMELAHGRLSEDDMAVLGGSADCCAGKGSEGARIEFASSAKAGLND